MFYCNSDMDQLSDKSKEISGANSSKSDAALAQETFTEGVLTRNRTSSITKSPAVPRPRTRSLSGSSQSDILTPESEKQSPGPGSMVKRASVPAKPEQLSNEVPTKGRRRRRTKAQIAADNAAKQMMQELEKKAANLSGVPVAKKPGRPRGRPKKVRTPVETPTSTVTNSPTSLLHNEEPLPPLNASNQELFESPTGDQETTKSSIDDFDVEQQSIDNVTTLPPTVGMTLLKEDELTFKEGTPLLKEDITPPPVAETKAPHSSGDKNVMSVVEEQSKEECKKVAAKTTKEPSKSEVVEHQDEPEGSSSQPVMCPDSISAEDTPDSGPKEQLIEALVEKTSEPMDVSPREAASAEVPSEKMLHSSALPDSVTTAKELSSNLPTDNNERMDSELTAIGTNVDETSTQICSAGNSATTATLTNAESTFADSFLTTCAVTAVTNSTNNPVVSLKASSSPPNALKSSTKTVMSAATAVSSSASSSSSSTSFVASSGIATTSTGNAVVSNSGSTKTVTTCVSANPPSSSGDSTVTSISAKNISAVVSSSPSYVTVSNGNANAIASSVSSSDIATTITAISNSNSNGLIISSSTSVTAGNSSSGTKDVVPSAVSLEGTSSGATGMNSDTKNVTPTVVPSTASSVTNTYSASQPMMSTIPSASLATSTIHVSGVTTVGSALSKICNQPLMSSHVVTTTISSTSVTSTGKPTVTSTPIDAPRDVAKLDPLPINLNTSLSVTLPTLSSLLTTPSGHQKLVLPLEKLVLPPSLESSAATTGAFISSPPISKPGHSCSYVITSMQMKDADPVSLAVSTMAPLTKENSLHSTPFHQKVTAALHAPIISSVASLEPKRSEPESKLREIAPKTLGLEFHHLTSDITRSSGGKKPELYEVLSNLKAVNRSLGGSESKSSSFSSSTTIASIIGQSSGNSGQVVTADKEQHKPRPIAIKPDGMDLLRQIPAAVATSSRTYSTVHPLFPLPAGTSSKTANLMSSFDLFRSVPTTQKQYSSTANISASVLPHLPGSSIAAYPPQKAPPPLISITDGPSQTVLGSVRVKVIDAPASAHQSSLSSLPAHMKANRPRPLSSQQSSISAPTVTTSLVSVTGSVPAPPTTYSGASQQYVPHPLTIGVHASTSSKVPSTAEVVVSNCILLFVILCVISCMKSHKVV